jgi:hypothetical protein
VTTATIRLIGLFNRELSVQEMKSILLILGLLVTGIEGCSIKHAVYPDTKAGALEIARRAYTQKYSGQLTNFDITISDDPAFDQWNVWFLQRGPDANPGGHILIRINKKNGSFVLEPSS